MTRISRITTERRGGAAGDVAIDTGLNGPSLSEMNESDVCSAKQRKLVQCMAGLIWQRVGCVCDRRAGSQGGRDHGGFDDLGVGGTGLARVAAVDIDAIRTLRGQRNGDGNQ